MIPIKRKIRARFDAASQSYEGAAHVQKHSAEFLVEKLREIFPEFHPQTILDLGTGTGYVPEILLPYYSKSLYTLNDISPRMVKTVQSKFKEYSNFKFYVGDMENENFQDHELIVSNLAMQWVGDLTGTLQKFYKKSKVLAFSCLLDGTFCEWEGILKSYGLSSVLRQYPAEKDLVLFCKKLGTYQFYFEPKDFHLKFPNVRSFMGYLKDLGAGAGNVTLSISVLKSLLTDQTQEFEVTYKIGFGIMRRI